MTSAWLAGVSRAAISLSWVAVAHGRSGRWGVEPRSFRQGLSAIRRSSTASPMTMDSRMRMLATVESARARPRSLTQRLTAHPGDVAERGVAEAGQDVDVEVGAVALVGGEADVVGVEPFVDPAGEGDLAVFGVDEHVAVLVGFDGVRAGGGGFGGGGC